MLKVAEVDLAEDADLRARGPCSETFFPCSSQREGCCLPRGGGE